MKTSEVLYRAADLIEERGWQSGDGWVSDASEANAPLCLEGGIMAAIGLRFIEGDPDAQFAPLHTCPAYRAVTDYLDREQAGVLPSGWGFTGQPLYWWNDERPDDSGAAEVIEVLRAAAVIEAAKEAADERESVTA